jgi:hypothetical protein
MIFSTFEKALKENRATTKENRMKKEKEMEEKQLRLVKFRILIQRRLNETVKKRDFFLNRKEEINKKIHSMEPIKESKRVCAGDDSTCKEITQEPPPDGYILKRVWDNTAYNNEIYYYHHVDKNESEYEKLKQELNTIETELTKLDMDIPQLNKTIIELGNNNISIFDNQTDDIIMNGSNFSYNDIDKIIPTKDVNGEYIINEEIPTTDGGKRKTKTRRSKKTTKKSKRKSCRIRKH